MINNTKGESMKKIILSLGIGLPLLLNATCSQYIAYEIATGSKTGTYFQIGKNLAKYIAPDACIKLKVLNTKGSMDNAYKLRSPKYKKLKFAIVQNDVLQELEKFANKGNQKAKNLVDNLRVLIPLYDEEIHIISKVGSGIKDFGDLKGKVLSIGKKKSGTTMTSFLLYKELFDTDLEYFQNESFDQALLSLEKGDVDAIIKVAGQPVARMSKQMDKSASKHIQLLSYDERNSNHNPITSYYTADIYAKNYPWLNHDTPTLSTKAYLITFNYTNPREKNNIKNFVQSIRKHLSAMQKNATTSQNTPHPKWKQVSDPCTAKLPGGWKFYSAVEEICGGSGASKVSVKAKCTSYEKSLGLCK
jgi:TRAP transporter TAXI family solute receptor